MTTDSVTGRHSTEEFDARLAEAFGRKLFEEFERLDPGVDELRWEDLPDRTRELYRLCALAVVREARFRERLSSPPDHN